VVLRDPTIAAGIGQFAAIQATAPFGIELSAVDHQPHQEPKIDLGIRQSSDAVATSREGHSLRLVQKQKLRVVNR
jgi:hypothetical protein